MRENRDTLVALAARVDELESRQHIVDLTSEYCHGFDKRDFDRFLAIWSEDCVWNIGPPFGTFRGHAGIHEAVQGVLWPAWQESHHLSTNHIVRFQDADNATCVCDVDCIGTLTGDTDCQMVGATYSDTLQRRAGRWLIIQRDVQIHYFNPIPGAPLVPPQG
ncbi:MAG: nuclear transport factor 2 family protein [Halieaceae bacterium]|uniref:nuclear transport factor 2 family protein n=1 Tax=Haliea alexandrii TaxID=2448162 RepID=UPI000F0B9836|nr:nuclear transport factor 2 family protein [Haliea alexandrii]MCR9186146.1 nuclear transport factor 2 family protein [Halieaceae bacterium]